MAYSKRPYLVAVVVMNAFALLVVHLKQPGSARYLFPSLPFLLVGAGLFFDHMKTKAGVTAAIALIVGTATYYAAQKYTWAFQPSMSARAVELRNVVDTFRSRSIEHVWGAPYLDVVPVRFIAGERPVISSDPDLWTERRDEPEMYAARRSQSKQGVLLTSFVPAPGDRIMTFDTRRLRLTPVSDKGFYKIFEATPVK
jgi:hypothetical protein